MTKHLIYQFNGKGVKRLIALTLRNKEHTYSKCESLELFGKGEPPSHDAEPALFLIKGNTVYLTPNVYPESEERLYAEEEDEFSASVQNTIDFVDSISLDMFPDLDHIRDDDKILIDLSGEWTTVTIV